uniref:C2H2-type domain-containing protein n=1 Tax=Brassica oleracea var. oleracea TaxID=109376 RepID=A0A0D2ZQS2_BRAOL
MGFVQLLRSLNQTRSQNPFTGKVTNPTLSPSHLRVLLPVNKRGLLHSPKPDLCQKVSSFELDDSLVHCVLPIFEVEDGAVQREEVRRECGKGFTSSKALCGHMACHFEREKRVSCSQFFQVKMSVKSSVISHGLV